MHKLYYTEIDYVKSRLKEAFIKYDRLYRDEGHWTAEWDYHCLSSMTVPRMEMHGFKYIRAYNIKTVIDGRKRWQAIIHFSVLPAEKRPVSLHPTMTILNPPLSAAYAENESLHLEQMQAASRAWIDQLDKDTELYTFLRFWDAFLTTIDLSADDRQIALKWAEIDGDVTEQGMKLAKKFMRYLRRLSDGGAL